MSIIEIVCISVGLAMDAFAIAICKGLSMKKLDWKKAIIIGAYFGIFQSLMPIAGYFLGTTFETLVSKIDHWLTFILLFFIGLNMIRESLEVESKNCNDDVSFKTMIILAIATSIDAFAVGVTFAFFKVKLLLAVIVIGIITFILSILGVKIGNKFGGKYENKAEFIGGCVLIVMGVEMLVEHLGIL